MGCLLNPRLPQDCVPRLHIWTHPQSVLSNNRQGDRRSPAGAGSNLELNQSHNRKRELHAADKRIGKDIAGGRADPDPQLTHVGRMCEHPPFSTYAFTSRGQVHY